jgi:4-amino-4-deoxy-L-arabinose transferase-like glycosyltransferase
MENPDGGDRPDAGPTPSDAAGAEEPGQEPEAGASRPAASAYLDTENKQAVSRPRAEPGAADFFRTHPLLRAEPGLPASLGSRLFNLLALSPLVVLTLLLAAQVLPALDSRSLWYSDEIRHAAVFRELADNGHWLLLRLNGELYPDKPPLYFWFLLGLRELLALAGTEEVNLYFAGAAVSGLLFLWAALFFGRFVARYDGRTQLASGLILLTCAAVMGLLHYARMDLLFSALVVCSHAAFYHAWVRPQAAGCMVLGFTLAALAVLTKGALGLALPLAAGLFFLCWRGTPRRILRGDFLLGLLVGLALISAWAAPAALELGGFDAFFRVYVQEQTVNRLVNAFHHQEPWYYYLAALPLIFLPWTPLLLALPWTGLFGARMRAGLAASRRPEGEGYGYLWCVAISSLLLLSAVSTKLAVYFLPSLPALALLAGRAALQLSARRSALFRHSLALTILLAGLALGIASLMLFGLLPRPPLKGLPGWELPLNTWFFLTAGGMILAAFLLWLLLRSSRPEGTILTAALSLTVLSFPLATQVAPSFSAVLSPESQARAMKDLAGRGFTPVSFRDYGGTYTYYLGRTILETRDPAVVAELAARERIALAIPLSVWESWPDRPAGCEEAHRQWLETRLSILLACEPAPPAAPEPDPAAPEPDPAAPEPDPAAL